MLNAECPIACYFHGQSILIVFLRPQRNKPRRAQRNKSQRAPNAINRNAPTTFDPFLRHLDFPFHQDTFSLRQQFCKGQDRNYRIYWSTLMYCSPFVFGALYTSFCINPIGLSEPKNLLKALNTFLIPFQGIE
jgi:hypothetical protein